MDKASDFGSEDCRFESCHDRKSFFLSFKAIQKEACSVLIREMEEKRDKTRKTHKNKTEKTKQMTLFQNLSNANHWLAYTTFLLNNNAREKTRLKMMWLLPQIIQPAPGSGITAASQCAVRDHPNSFYYVSTFSDPPATHF